MLRQKILEGKNLRYQRMAHPTHISDERGAFVCRVKPGRSVFEADRPYEKKSIIHITQ